MSVFIATFPPLEQVTHVKAYEIKFHAVLEVPKHLASEPWQLALWHSRSSSTSNDKPEWAEATFVPTVQGDESHNPTTLHWPNSDGLARLYFTATVPSVGSSSLDFTIKFRQSSALHWRWIRDEQGLADGVVTIDDDKPIQRSDIDGDLPGLIHNLNPDLKWKSHMSQCPGTRLWSIEVPVDGVKGDKSAFATVPLGVPWGQFIRWFALIRDWAPWLAPRHGRSSFELERDAILCSFLSSQGKHLVLLGISGLSDVTTLFRSDQSGQVTVHIRNENTEPGTGTVLVGVGSNFESANAAVMYHARNLAIATNKKSTVENEAEIKALVDDVKPQWYENWYDGLGYCTWNALGIKLTDEKVLQALDILSKNNIGISNLIIDDNWQDIDYSGTGHWQQSLNDFEAEPKAFPKGLKALVSEIRSKHKNIQTIAVWHALLGYWGGISPTGAIAKRYKTIELARADQDAERRNIPLGGKMTVVAKQDVSQFYNDYYSFLSECGIDGVKTDAQFMMDTWTSAEARRELVHTYLDAWTLASLRHFSNRAISCMSQSPQIIFYSQLPRNRPAVLCRNSDDFFPDVISSHPWHVWTNAHNALLTQHLNVLPDWDMFQTAREPYAAFHAAARCISGGPIYITDVPGQHNMDLIKQMTGFSPKGNKTVIFRPSVLGRTVDVYANYDDLSLLKVGAYHGRAATGTPILGVFNISGRTLTEILPLEGGMYFSGVLKGTWYVVRSHTSGRVTEPVMVGEEGGREKLITVSLGVAGWDILTAFPMAVFNRGGSDDGEGSEEEEKRQEDKVYVSNLGLLGKMTGSAAILGSTKYTLQENGRVFVDVNLKALGVLGIYVSSLPEMTGSSSVEDSFMVTIQGQPIPPHSVSVSKADDRVLEVDIETAWKEMELESGWANEVEVKVYFPL